MMLLWMRVLIIGFAEGPGIIIMLYCRQISSSSFHNVLYSYTLIGWHYITLYHSLLMTSFLEDVIGGDASCDV